MEEDSRSVERKGKRVNDKKREIKIRKGRERKKTQTEIVEKLYDQKRKKDFGTQRSRDANAECPK